MKRNWQTAEKEKAASAFCSLISGVLYLGVHERNWQTWREEAASAFCSLISGVLYLGDHERNCAEMKRKALCQQSEHTLLLDLWM